MSNNLEFLISLVDKFSPAIKAAKTVADESTVKIAQDMKHVERSADTAHEGVNRLKGGLGVLAEAAAPLVAAFASFEFFKGSVDEFNEGAQALGQLEASLNSTKGAAGLTSEALRKQAEELQKSTLFTDDATMKMQSLLLTFTNIKGAVFSDAVPAIQDLATKMGGDLQGAAVQVGKALNDPIQGINALRRVGVSFTDDQRNVIKSLVETGHVAEAQKLILKELNTEFGGSAEAAAKAGTGPFTLLAHRFADVRKEIGGLVVQLGTALMPVFNGIVTVAGDVITVFKELFSGLGDGFANIQQYVQPVVDFIGQIPAAIHSILSPTSQWAAYINVIKHFIGVVWDTVRSVAGNVWHILSGVIKWVGQSELLKDIFSVIGWFAEITYKALKAIGNVMEWLWDHIVKPIFDAIETAYKTAKAIVTLGGLIGGGEESKAGATVTMAGQNVLGNQQTSLLTGLDAVAQGLKKNAMQNGGGILVGLGGGGDTPKTGNGNVVAGNIGRGMSDSINSGGQRSVTINIQKQVGAEQIHVMTAKEGAQEIEQLVVECMRRVLYSVNGVLVN